MFDFLLDLLFPRFCLGCGRETEWICDPCREKLKIYTDKCCAICNAHTEFGTLCARCGEKNIADIFISYSYAHATVKGLLGHIKHHCVQEAVDILSEITCRALKKRATHNDTLLKWTKNPRDCVLVPVPLHRKRLKERGFNQSLLLAQGLAGYFGWEIQDCLKKTKITRAQTLLKRQERLHNVRDAFILEKNHGLVGKNVIIVDDVITTGSTIMACAAALRSAGALGVNAIVVAKNSEK